MTARRKNARADARPLRERRRQVRPRRWWRSPWPFVGAASISGIALVAFFTLGHQQAALALPSGSELTGIQQAATHVSADVLEAVGTGDLPNPIKPMNN